jgi:type IV pilus assembly protein PilA
MERICNWHNDCSLRDTDYNSRDLPMRRDTQGGFTLIEVMLVVVIIGVLTSIVLPSVRQNAAQAKMSEAILAFGTCKNAVSEVYLSTGVSPGAGNWGCENETGPVSQYVGTIRTTPEGIIKVDIDGVHDLRLDHHTITLEPLDDTGVLMSDGAGAVRRWRCGNPAAGTDLDMKYLPSSCRGI